MVAAATAAKATVDMATVAEAAAAKATVDRATVVKAMGAFVLSFF